MKDPKSNWIHVRPNKTHNTYEYLLIGDWKTFGYSLIFFKDSTLPSKSEFDFQIYVVKEILDFILSKHDCTYKLCEGESKKERFSWRFIWSKEKERLPV